MGCTSEAAMGRKAPACKEERGRAGERARREGEAKRAKRGREGDRLAM